MKRRLRGPVVLALFALLALVAACQLVAGIDRVDKGNTPPDAGFEAAPPIPDPCVHLAPPAPPTDDDDPVLDHQLAPFYVATTEIHLFGKNDGGGASGFDLDGVCTCEKGIGTAYDGGASCIGPVTCDREGGVDNGSLTILDSFGAFLPPGQDLDTAAGVNNRIAAGDEGLLLLITNYNGRANDKEVNVGLVLSHGIRDSSGCGADASITQPPYPPGWCGRDKWSVDPNAVVGGSPPYLPSLVASAYVTNYTLVLSNERGYFQVPFGDLTVSLFSPIVVATIVPLGDGTFGLDDALLTGRVPASSMLAVAGALDTPGVKDAGPSNKYLCQSPVFGLVKETFCSARDIASSKQVDFDPKAICDSISTTTAFRARPAAVGLPYKPPDLFNACLTTGNDSGTLAQQYQCP